METLSKWLEQIRKVTVSAAVVLGVVIVAVLVVREVSKEGMIVEPVVVQLPDLKSAPTPDLAAQQIAASLNLIQSAGVAEWQRLYVDQSTNPIDLQVPGAPLTLRASIREIAALFGVTRPTIRASLAVRREPAGYVGSVSLVGEPGARAICEAADVPSGVDEVLECLALSVMTLRDPKVAALYVFRAEEKACNSLDTPQVPDASDVTREERRIRNRRERCAFERTQALIARTLESGRAADLPWVPYVFGLVHLARAAALADIDRAQQLGELDQAIGRFSDTLSRMPNSPTALAVLIDAFIRKGVSIHETTPGMAWTDDPASPLQWQLYLAESTFAEAVEKLRDMPQRRDRALDALVRRLEGHLIYRQWLLVAHRRTQLPLVTVALGQPAELEMLTDAANRYAAAAANGPQSVGLFLEWGDVLRAKGEFDGAVERYLRAADLSPGDATPRLSIAIAYLDRVGHGPEPAVPIHLLVALGASSSYLSWASNGSPDPTFIGRVVRALGRSGHAEDGAAFKFCLEEALNSTGTPDDHDVERWKLAAALKLCIDEAIEQVNGRVVAAPRELVAPARVR
ncbi:MAG: tetratricopeptide repeat protein [Reyranella sp.]|uniref:tetratricopeptide repeat protein n=1 Tax=Reyranella sp. TaxID=1929291 RepID=UPI003D0D39A4